MSILFLVCSAVVILLLCACHIGGNSPYVYGAEAIKNDPPVISITMRAEQTQWKHRTVDGKPQKRLWSITYGKWLTDWEWV